MYLQKFSLIKIWVFGFFASWLLASAVYADNKIMCLNFQSLVVSGLTVTITGTERLNPHCNSNCIPPTTSFTAVPDPIGNTPTFCVQVADSHKDGTISFTVSNPNALLHSQSQKSQTQTGSFVIEVTKDDMSLPGGRVNSGGFVAEMTSSETLACDPSNHQPNPGEPNTGRTGRTVVLEPNQ